MTTMIPVDYNKKTKEQLISICKDRTIRGYSTKNKGEIVALLQADDASRDGRPPAPSPVSISVSVSHPSISIDYETAAKQYLAALEALPLEEKLAAATEMMQKMSPHPSPPDSPLIIPAPSHALSPTPNAPLILPVPASSHGLSSVSTTESVGYIGSSTSSLSQEITEASLRARDEPIFLGPPGQIPRKGGKTAPLQLTTGTTPIIFEHISEVRMRIVQKIGDKSFYLHNAYDRIKKTWKLCWSTHKDVAAIARWEMIPTEGNSFYLRFAPSCGPEKTHLPETPMYLSLNAVWKIECTHVPTAWIFSN